MVGAIFRRGVVSFGYVQYTGGIRIVEDPAGGNLMVELLDLVDDVKEYSKDLEVTVGIQRVKYKGSFILEEGAIVGKVNEFTSYQLEPEYYI